MCLRGCGYTNVSERGASCDLHRFPSRHPPGLRASGRHQNTFSFGNTLAAEWFAQIQHEAAWIAGESECSGRSSRGDHVTNSGRGLAASCANSACSVTAPGRTQDFLGDYGYRRDRGQKRLVFPQLAGLSRFAALFGSNLRNLRLNGMGTESSLSAHEEESISPQRWGVAEHIVRFHLPIFTNMRCIRLSRRRTFPLRRRHPVFLQSRLASTRWRANYGRRSALSPGARLLSRLPGRCFAMFFPGTPSDRGLEKSMCARNGDEGRCLQVSRLCSAKMAA